MENEVTFFKVCDVSDLPPGEGKVVHAGTKKLALFNLKGEFFCMQNYCPHAGGFLGLGDVEGQIVRCPRHGWGFDIKSGACKTNARYSACTYQTEVRDGSVYVGLPTHEEPL